MTTTSKPGIPPFEGGGRIKILGTKKELLTGKKKKKKKRILIVSQLLVQVVNRFSFPLDLLSDTQVYH